MAKCTRQLLKEMQVASHTIQDYVSLTEQYEACHFHSLEEVEYDYLNLRKHYLGKALSLELAHKLENNSLTRPCFSGSGQQQQLSSPYSNLSLNTAIHPELVETFFHQLLRRLIKDEEFKTYIAVDQLVHSLFTMFHIEANAKSRFAAEFNELLTEAHAKIQEMLEATEEAKEAEMLPLS